VDPLIDARYWKKQNPDAYAQIIRWAKWDISMHKRPSIKLYFELLRRPWFAQALGMMRCSKQFLLNNTLAASVAALLNEEEGLGFPTRKRKSDEWGTAGVAT
jgi:hypothetical protein